MKSSVLFPVLILILAACTSPKKKELDLEKLKAEDDRILEALHEEPARMGTKKIQKEDLITTEIWTYNVSHGSPDKVVETLLFKNEKLISHTMSDSLKGYSFSRQFKDDKVIEASEVNGDKVVTYYFDENEKILARLTNSECIRYSNGENPRGESLDKCEREFNTAP